MVIYETSAETNAPDVVSMDVPFLTRVMEKCREGIKTDVDLHLLLEKIIAKAGTGTLTMKDYKAMVPQDAKPSPEEALVKGWSKYDKLKLKAAKLHVATKAGHEIDLVKGDILGLRLSSNGKLTRMITEKYGPTIIVTLTHVQADNIRKKCGRTA